MTPAEPYPHLDADAVADLAEDLLDPVEAAAARRHVAVCSRCNDLTAALDDIRARLQLLPVEPVPAPVVARLDAALAAERQRVPALQGASARVGHRRRGWSGSRAPQWLAAAATVTMLVVGGTFVVRGLEVSGMDAATSGGTAESAPEPAAGTGGAAKAGPESAAERAPGPPTLRQQRLGEEVPVLASGRRYVTSALPTQVAALLRDADSVAARTKPDMNAQSNDQLDSPGAAGDNNSPRPFVFAADADLGGRLGELGPLFAAPRLAGCLGALPDAAGRRPLAVDLADYAGAPAALIVLEVPADRSLTEAYVVGPDCRANDPQVRSRAFVPVQ